MEITSKDVKRLLDEATKHSPSSFNDRASLMAVQGRLEAWLDICLEEEKSNPSMTCRMTCSNGMLDGVRSEK